MENQLSPTRSRRAEPGERDAGGCSQAAPLVAQAARLHTEMCTFANDLDVRGTAVSGPVVVNRIVSRLAGTGLTTAEVIRSLSGKLDWSLIDLDRRLEVAEAFNKAGSAFAEACRAAQAAIEVMH